MYSTRQVETILRSHRDTLAKIKFLELLLRNPDRTFMTLIPVGHDDDDDAADHQDLSAMCGDLLSEELALKQMELLCAQVKLVDAWLTLLTPEERFIIETHTISGLDWARTIIEHEQKWGKEQGRSDRTLKRIQAKAIRRIWLATNSWLRAETKE